MANKMRLLATKELGLFTSELIYHIEAIRGTYCFFADKVFDVPFGIRVEIIDMDQREALVKLPNTGFAVVSVSSLALLEE